MKEEQNVRAELVAASIPHNTQSTRAECSVLLDASAASVRAFNILARVCGENRSPNEIMSRALGE